MRVIGISSWRCSSLEAFNEIASLGRTGARPNSSIFGMIPDVDSVIRLGEIPMPSGSVSRRVAFNTLGKLSSGSPIPIITMFTRLELAASWWAFKMNSTCPTISPAVKFRSNPMSAVRQNLQFTGHPTWLEMHRVSRPVSGISTASMVRRSSSPSR